MSVVSLYRSTGRHATWLELFFDLVFVAVIGVVTHDLAHTHNGHIGAEQLLRFPLVFIPVWWIWMTHTLYSNRFDKDSREHRLFSLCLMALLVVLSLFVESSLEQGFALFALLYGAIRLMLAYLYWTIHRSKEQYVHFAKDVGTAIAVGALVSMSAALISGPAKFVVFYLGIIIDAGLQILLRHKLNSKPVDKVHLVERIGLLVIIILGESLIAMVGSLDHEQWDLYSTASSITGFLLIGAIWWIYFDSFPTLERAKRLTSGNILIFTHLLLCMGLLILANMIRHAILGDLDRPTFALLAITGLVFFYLGKQIPYWYAFPIWRRAIVSNTFICIGITVGSSFLSRIEYSLIGMTLGMLVYVYLTFKRILAVDVDNYLEAPHAAAAAS
ncbi:Low temperature requirement protein LtrA [Microbulbifer donghaiensis]|uniref:Low temperature requirement protein LtrA n=1 Tax=Microbulbifer donghaiensis TaxID=494016 RepID=A0A1M4UTZ1_9GAMM|nr:low temperature requirement protein A [Microbulbifer donghaiensis]SHE60149.1 Low temperature requirement protein LtrA [Microbulbifer donghaiensis]